MTDMDQGSGKKVFIPIFINGEPGRVARKMQSRQDVMFQPLEIWSNLDTQETGILMEVQYSAKKLNEIHQSFQDSKEDKELIGPDMYHLYLESQQPLFVWWQQLASKTVQLTYNDSNFTSQPSEDILAFGLAKLEEETAQRWTRQLHPRGAVPKWYFIDPVQSFHKTIHVY
jgi:hypothetical protein